MPAKRLPPKPQCLNDIINYPPYCTNCGQYCFKDEGEHKCNPIDVMEKKQEDRALFELAPLKIIRDAFRKFDKN